MKTRRSSLAPLCAVLAALAEALIPGVARAAGAGSGRCEVFRSARDLIPFFASLQDSQPQEVER